MADWLLLRFPHSPDQAASWLVVDSRGAAVGPPQTGPLSLATPRAVGRRVCLLVPGTDVLLAEPDIPAKAGAKIQQLVPFALEEQLAEDIDELHFAIGKRIGESSRIPVAVVARSQMDEWLATLRASGLEPEAMYADSDLLPENPGQAVALLEEEVVVVRPPSGSPVTLPASELAEALQIAQQSAPAAGETAGRGLILYTGAAEWHQHSAQVEGLRERFDGIKIQLLTAGPLALFAQQLPLAKPTNLLQGAYAPLKQSSANWRQWRVAAILLASLIGLHVIGKAMELSLLKRNEHKLDVSIRETLQSAMPNEQSTSTADARNRMQARWAAIQGGSAGGLLSALASLVQAKSSAPGVKVQSLNFHNGTLELKLAAPDATSLSRLSHALENIGWKADLTHGSVVVGGGYEGSMTIHGI